MNGYLGVGLGVFATGIPLGFAFILGFMAFIVTFPVIATAISLSILFEELKPSKDLNKVDAAQHAAAGADLQHN